MKILIADDDHSVRFILRVQLEKWGYSVISCKDGNEAMQHLLSPDPPRIAILDWHMEGYTGIEISKVLKNRSPLIYIVLFTVRNSEEDLVEAIDSGAHCFQSKPVSPGVLRSHLEVGKRLIEAEDRLQTQEREIRIQSYMALADLAEVRHNVTGSHMKRISLYSQLLASLIGLSQEACEELSLFSRFHDIGKVGISDSILLSKDTYSKYERDIMNTHTLIGYKILASVPTLNTAALIARNHHERWDGTGYPDGLTGEKIPLEARIVTIVDIYDALRAKRSYKESWEHSQVLTYLKNESGRIFDPNLVKTFIEHQAEFDEIYRTNADDPNLVDPAQEEQE